LSYLSISPGRRKFAFEEIEKPVLIRADLEQDDVIVASLDVAIDGLKMAL
jgi:hypothetical protein